MGTWLTAQQTGLNSAAKASTSQTERFATTSGRLSFYQTPPSSIISIEAFEQLAINRLRGEPRVYLDSLHPARRILLALWQPQCSSDVLLQS